MADYDGDGRADIVVFRPAIGHWFILKSTASYSAWDTYLGGDLSIWRSRAGRDEVAHSAAGPG